MGIGSVSSEVIMNIVKRIKQATSEFPEQAAIVRDTYGGSKLHWMLDMGYCMARYGARPIDYVRFEFHRKSARERNRYLTICRYFRVQKHFGAGLPGISGKLEEYQTFKDFIKRDWMEVQSDTSDNLVEEFIRKHGESIAKPVNGEQGKGVLKITGTDTSDFQTLLSERKKTPYILEEIVCNCRELAEVNSSSLNTVRATTLIGKDGTPQILSIILRVGAPGSHVDNWGSGGVGYNFDLQTGVCNMYGRDKKNNPYVKHPGSNVQMIGFKLPRYEELRQYVYDLTSVYPSARYVGWDIAITSTGFDLIEMNCPAGHDMFQSFDNPIYDIMKKNW